MLLPFWYEVFFGKFWGGVNSIFENLGHQIFWTAVSQKMKLPVIKF